MSHDDEPTSPDKMKALLEPTRAAYAGAPDLALFHWQKTGHPLQQLGIDEKGTCPTCGHPLRGQPWAPAVGLRSDVPLGPEPPPAYELEVPVALTRRDTSSASITEVGTYPHRELALVLVTEDGWDAAIELRGFVAWLKANRPDLLD